MAYESEELLEGDHVGEAIGLLHDFTCIVIRENIILAKLNGKGVSTLLQLYTSGEETLRGSILIDRVIGKAAATLAILGGAKAVYGKIMSRPGQQLLAQYGIECAYGELVEYIANRTDTGVCPIESSVLGSNDLYESVVSIKKTVAMLMERKQ